MHAVDPNEVFGTAAADPSSESDSGISEETPVTMATGQPEPATVYQVVYDISSVGGATSEPGQENIISIELGRSNQTLWLVLMMSSPHLVSCPPPPDEWSSQLIFSESCIVNELPPASSSSSSSSSPLDDSLSSAPLSSRHQVRRPVSERPQRASPSLPVEVQLFPDLRLTEEEQKLLTEEGVSLPSSLPLTKVQQNRI